MRRSHLFLGISGALALLVAGSIAINGCKAPTEGAPQPQQFANLRIMNFAPSDANCHPTAPMDVYWDTKTPVSVLGNNAKIYNLQYGDAAVYTSSLAVAASGTDYQLVVTPTRIPSQYDIGNPNSPLDLKLFPGKYTLMITRDPNNPGAFLHTLIQDGASDTSSAFTYVRFFNMQANSGALSVRVNDPVTGQLINTTPLSFNQLGTTYMALKVAKDTSFAFFVVNSSNQVLARLSYQTFVGGSSYTLVYAGDPCQTVANNPADTTISALDTLRLRAFDDNTTGNDQTNPILYSYRYNIVNDIYPDTGYSVLGFLNGVSFPQYYGFSINPIPALRAGGVYSNPVVDPSNQQDTSYNVYYQSTALTDPLDIKIFSTTPTGKNATLAYDFNQPGPQASIPPDKPVTFLFYGPDTGTKGATEWNVQQKILQVPDVSDPNSIIFAFYNGMNTSYKVAGTSIYSSFYITGPGGVDTSLTNLAANSRPAMTIYQIPASSSGEYTITDSIGRGTNVVPGNSETFTAQPGGIYEVFSLGVKTDPHLLIMRVNASN